MVERIIILVGLMIPAVAAAERPAVQERYDDPAQDQPMIVREPEPVEATVKDIRVEPVTGDVLEMQPGDTIIITPLDSPRRGISMDRVKNELGQPVEISPSVGEPPITRWTYADRVVFFEYSRVIHVVERR